MPTYKHNGEILYCPKCGSKKLQAKETSYDDEDSSYDEEMGYMGEALFGAGGLALGENDRDITHMTCLKCRAVFKVE